ncbi:MAG: helix-turn-helix domain-containing protein [Candidatus Paceibacterota bacterium]
MNSLKSNLLSLGFDAKEAEIYLFLLSNKDVPAYTISRETGIPRTTVYKLLEGLGKRGLVNDWLKNSVRHYSPESPKRLRELVKIKEEALNESFPGLIELFNTDVVNPTTKLYLGKEGVKQVFEILLDNIQKEKLKRLYVYSDYWLTEQFPKYFHDWRIRKNKTKAFTQLIVPYDTPMTEDYSSNEYRETRIMPKEFSFFGSVDINGSLVAFFSFKDKEIYSILIDSPIVAEMLTKLFSYIWSSLPPRQNPAKGVS